MRPAIALLTSQTVSAFYDSVVWLASFCSKNILSPNPGQLSGKVSYLLQTELRAPGMKNSNLSPLLEKCTFKNQTNKNVIILLDKIQKHFKTTTIYILVWNYFKYIEIPYV